MGNSERKPNRLINEKSPYLLQHADNPVDWYPWGEEAFEKARREGKPVFLSVGYSTCHWCHVMAHESFEDPQVARLMNAAFVNIKVDREERPDIDHIYMTFCQMITGSGGWPLTIIMTPEKKPFFAGTYFPKKTRSGIIGMMDLVPRIKDVWTKEKEEILRSAEQIAVTMKGVVDIKKGNELDENILKKTLSQLLESYDSEYGGFGSAPKFPAPHNLLFLLRYWKICDENSALEVVEKTLEAMQLGGIYDHLGSGFHRYSTDKQWLVPHFEKMLYDQALIAMVYTEAFQATKKRQYADTAQETFSYILRDMTSQRGGFYSAEDADSEGKEGKFYLWTMEEMKELLEKEDIALVVDTFNIEREGNFSEEATREKTGNNILHLKKPLSQFALDRGLSEDDLRNRLKAIKKKLFREREKRIRPHKDDKVLTDWNGLMIASLARGARVFQDEILLKAAEKAVRFILTEMRTGEGLLYHRYRDGESSIKGYLDDYAFLIWGLLELYGASFNVDYLRKAMVLNDMLLNRFWDEKEGGFFLTPDDSDANLIRPKSFNDGAIPSGNSVSALNMLRLSHVTGDYRLFERALEVEQAFSEALQRSPSNYATMMIPLLFRLSPFAEVVIAGNPDSEDTKLMLKALNNLFLPNTVVLLRPDKEIPEISSIADFTRDLKAIDGKATAYICRNFRCSLPTTDVDEMLTLLGIKSR